MNMNQTMRTKTLSITISRPWKDVFDFLADAENLPRWNRGYCRQLKKQAGKWCMDSPLGEVQVQLITDHFSGVLDQQIIPSTGPAFRVPLRVLENGEGSEVVMTVFRTA